MEKQLKNLVFGLGPKELQCGQPALAAGRLYKAPAPGSESPGLIQENGALTKDIRQEDCAQVRIEPSLQEIPVPSHVLSCPSP
jgi:hypothetical protein